MTNWQRFVQYHCRSCEEACINDFRLDRTQAKECASCHAVAVLDDDYELDLDVDPGVPLDELPLPEASGPGYPPNPPGGNTRTPASASVSDGQKPGSAAERAARNVPRSDRERFPVRSDGGDDGEPL